MKINNKEISLLDLTSNIDYESYKLKDNKKGVLLTEYQIGVLAMYGFDYNKYSSLKELIFDVDNYLNDGYYEEDLEEVLKEISEFHYYNETNK